MASEDPQSQIDDINDRLDGDEQDTQDLSDNTDSNFNDVNTNIDDLNNNVSDLQQNEGQLTFPLSQDTIDLLSEQAPTYNQYLFNNNYIGTAVLVGGTVTILTNLITAVSLVLITRVTPGGTVGNLSYVVSDGSLTINSTNGADTSTVLYFILTS